MSKLQIDHIAYRFNPELSIFERITETKKEEIFPDLFRIEENKKVVSEDGYFCDLTLIPIKNWAYGLHNGSHLKGRKSEFIMFHFLPFQQGVELIILKNIFYSEVERQIFIQSFIRKTQNKSEIIEIPKAEYDSKINDGLSLLF